MNLQFDLKKIDWRLMLAFLAFIGFSNVGDLIRWARGAFFGIQPVALEQAITAEAKVRMKADSAMLERIEAGDRRDSVQFARLAAGNKRVEVLLLKVPQVKKYAHDEAKADSIRRREDRIRRLLFDQEANRGAGPRDREFR